VAAAEIKIILVSVNDAAHQGIGADLEQRAVVIFRSPAEPVVTSNKCRKPDKLWMFQPAEWETFVRIDARSAKWAKGNIGTLNYLINQGPDRPCASRAAVIHAALGLFATVAPAN